MGCCFHRAPSRPQCRNCSDLPGTSSQLLLVTQGQPNTQIKYAEGTASTSSCLLHTLIHESCRPHHLSPPEASVHASPGQCSGNKATDALAHKANMSCYFLAQFLFIIVFLITALAAFSWSALEHNVLATTCSLIVTLNNNGGKTNQDKSFLWKHFHTRILNLAVFRKLDFSTMC